MADIYGFNFYIRGDADAARLLMDSVGTVDSSIEKEFDKDGKHIIYGNGSGKWGVYVDMVDNDRISNTWNGSSDTSVAGLRQQMNIFENLALPLKCKMLQCDVEIYAQSDYAKEHLQYDSEGNEIDYQSEPFNDNDDDSLELEWDNEAFEDFNVWLTMVKYEKGLSDMQIEMLKAFHEDDDEETFFVISNSSDDNSDPLPENWSF